MNKRLSGVFCLVMALGIGNSDAQDITLVSNRSSTYKIVIPAEPTALEQKSATVLQKYISQVTGAQLPVVSGDAAAGIAAIYLGHTGKGDQLHPNKLPVETYLLQTEGKNLIIMGGSGQGLMYGVYAFLEKYAGCRKMSEAAVVSKPLSQLKIPAIKEEVRPQFEYRETYYPAANNAEFLGWNRLQKFEDLWGPHTWGHTYDKLVPAKTYFKEHPEYYALVKGRRQPSQLCLNNEAVYKIVVDELKKRMAASPDALYWSVSPNDDIGWCECDKCKPVDNEQGSPSGSLIKFVNRVAANFPDKKITSLAYGYTHKAPKSLRPASNVYIFLSDIDAYRDKPLAEEGSAGAFRNDLKAWGALTPNIFVWDYTTEFTNYLAPFPNFHTLQANIQYFKNNGVKGIFSQGSGDTYSEFAELRAYITARLLIDANANVKQLTDDFLTEYYGAKAGKYIGEYIALLQEKMLASHRKLDIYGNPVNEWNAYLSPDNIDLYSAILDRAEAAAEGNKDYMDRVVKARLPLEYTVLQQARFYGIERFGIFDKSVAGKWTVKTKIQEKVKHFIANCNKAGVTELSEGGATPDQYLAEWNSIFERGVKPTKAIGAMVTLQQPFTADYPAKGNRTIVDGTRGYDDFSYNWLCFYGIPMVATIDLGTKQSINTIQADFLDDPRHWIFVPESVKIEVSADGSKYETFAGQTFSRAEEHFELTTTKFAANKAIQARYIRVTAANGTNLPVWRFKEGKKPMIACGEVWVE